MDDKAKKREYMERWLLWLRDYISTLPLDEFDPSVFFGERMDDSPRFVADDLGAAMAEGDSTERGRDYIRRRQAGMDAMVSPRVERFKQRIEESSADRAAHALMDALRDFAVAIWNERSPDDRAQFARVIADAQTELLKSQATLGTLHVLPR